MSWMRKIYYAMTNILDGSVAVIVALTGLQKNTIIGKGFSTQASIIIPAGGTSYLLAYPNSIETEVFMYARKINAINDGTQPLDFTVEVFLDGVVSANGVPELVNNKNHNINGGNILEVYENPTVTSDGTSLSGQHYVAEKREFINTPDDLSGYVMKQQSNYLMKVHNNATVEMEFIVDWNWCESNFFEN